MLRRSRAIAVPAPVVLLLVAAVGLSGGCAPKRVVQGQVVRDEPGPPPPEPAPVSRPTPAPEVGAVLQPRYPELDLPEPEPRGPSGAPLPERRPESVTLGLDAATLALAQVGKPYQWGSSGPDSFDCSGLVQHVYGSLGIDLPRVSSDQAACGTAVRQADLQAGDLVFFSINGGGVDHVGICLGDREFVHAPRRNVPVCTESLDNSWWQRRYRTARRLR